MTSSALLKGFIHQALKEGLEKVFSFEKFSRLSTSLDQIEYCSSRLKKLGEGSARTVFSLNSLSVIKIASTEAGKEQNKVEGDGSACTDVADIFAAVTQRAPDFSWIVMEKVRPFANGAEFKKHIKQSEASVFKTLTYWYAQNIQKARHNQFEPDDYEEVLENPYVKKLVKAIRSCDLLPGDLAKFSSWGIASDKRVVLIDFGLTKGIYMKHYYR